MDLSTITVDDFKDLFYRDFPFLNTYDNAELYNAGDRVYYATTKLFYDCTVNGTTGILPTVTANWEAASDSVLNYVQDGDITRAFAEAKMNLNQALFSSDENIELGYLYLTAHYLVHDLRAALGGVSGTALFPVTSRSVGSVSESYNIPQAYLDNPILTFYTTSPYGLKFLAMVLPYMVGNVVAVSGGTLP